MKSVIKARLNLRVQMITKMLTMDHQKLMVIAQLEYFRNVYCVVINHRKDQDK